MQERSPALSGKIPAEECAVAVVPSPREEVEDDRFRQGDIYNIDAQDGQDGVSGWDDGDYWEIPLISAHFRSFEQDVGQVMAVNGGGLGGFWG